MWHRIDDPDNPPPKDGTRVLLAWPEGSPGDYASGAVAIGAIYDSGKLWLDNADDNEKAWPTHWQPLPPPPAEDTP